MQFPHHLEAMVSRWSTRVFNMCVSLIQCQPFHVVTILVFFLEVTRAAYFGTDIINPTPQIRTFSKKQEWPIMLFPSEDHDDYCCIMRIDDTVYRFANRYIVYGKSCTQRHPFNLIIFFIFCVVNWLSKNCLFLLQTYFLRQINCNI